MKFSFFSISRRIGLIILCIGIICGITSCNSLRHHQAPSLAVEICDYKVLYARMDNYINIAVSGYEDSAIQVSVDQGSIHKDGCGYVVKPSLEGPLNLKVFINDEVVRTVAFRVKRIEFIPALLTDGDYNNYELGGRITKNQLSENATLVVRAKDSELDISSQFWVESFCVFRFDNDTTISDYYSYTNHFTPEQILLFKSMEVGEKFYIDQFCVRFRDGDFRWILRETTFIIGSE